MTSPQNKQGHSRVRQCLRIAGLVASAMALIFVIMMFVLWQYRTPLLNNYAKPHLEQFLSTELEALVTIEQLTLDIGQLRMREMTVEQADIYRVTVPDLIMDFTLGKLLRKRLSSLRVEQPEIYFKPAVVSPGDDRSAPLSLHKPPISIDLVTVSNGRFDLELMDQVIEVRAIEFDMHNAPSGNFHLSFTVQGEQPLKLAATGQIQWDADPELHLSKLNIDDRQLLTAPLTLRLATNGLAAGGELVLAHFDRAQLDPWLALGGMQQSLPAEFDFTVQNLRLGVETGSGQVQGQLAIDRLQLIKGDVRTQMNNVRLDISGDLDQWHATGEAALAGGSPLSFKAQGSIDPLSGTLKLDLAGTPLLTLESDSEQLVAQLHRTSVSSLAEIVAPSLWPQVVEPRGSLTGQLQLSLAAEDVQGHFDITGEDLQAAGFDFGTSRISSQFFRQQEQFTLTDLSINASATGHGISIPVATLQGAARWRSPALQLDITALKLDNLEYLSADNMSALAGGSLDLVGTVAWNEAQQRLNSSLQGTAQVQEALVHSFYGDLSQLPINFVLKTDWNTVSESLQVDEVILSLLEIGQLKGHGSWNSDALEFGGEIRFPQLQNGFSLHLRPLLAPLIPELEQLDISGTLTADGDGTWGPDGWNIAGTLNPDALGLKHRTTNTSMNNLSGEIPFALSSSGGNGRVARNGFVNFTQFQTGSVVSEVNHLNLISTTNRLTFIDPWKLNLAGGQIQIENLSFGQESADMFVSGRTHIDNIDLQELTETLELTPMQGNLTADLGEFEYIGGLLQSEGEAHIDVFGGTIQVRNLKARDIFSSYRSFEGDIDFHGIDLEQLTRTFEFGEINGIIDGYIHDLRLFGKVPSAFVAELATRDEGERNISVKALNNLTVISQGGLSAALSRGIYQFIDFYRYRKIGLFCALRNDVFVLKGTARSDSDLHLVDGGLLPPRINVLAPGTGVSFREMLRRLERIDRTTSR